MKPFSPNKGPGSFQDTIWQEGKRGKGEKGKRGRDMGRNGEGKRKSEI
jgi:hypothetical protein